MDINIMAFFLFLLKKSENLPWIICGLALGELLGQNTQNEAARRY